MTRRDAVLANHAFHCGSYAAGMRLAYGGTAGVYAAFLTSDTLRTRLQA